MRKGHTLLTQLVVSGEVPLALTVYNYKAEQLKKQGAPIDWFVLGNAIARPNGIAVARKAPHPHAAVLFYDFELSPEGQQIIANLRVRSDQQEDRHAAQQSADEVRRREGRDRRIRQVEGTVSAAVQHPRFITHEAHEESVNHKGSRRTRRSGHEDIQIFCDLLVFVSFVLFMVYAGFVTFGTGPCRGRQEGGHPHPLHDDCGEGPSDPHQTVRVEIRRQGERLARGRHRTCCSVPSQKRRRRNTTSTSSTSARRRWRRWPASRSCSQSIHRCTRICSQAPFPAHRQWAATLLSVWVQAYNTKLIKRESLPKTYKDLLDPKWKGKLGIEGKDEDWFASVVDVMGGGETGLKFFRDLVATNGLSVRQGHTLLNNLVISGEVPLALNIYNYMPEQAKKKGAPIDWFAIEPAIARSNGVGVARHAPHPNAALLFYEYLLGEATAVFRQHGLRAEQHEGHVTAEGHQDRSGQSRRGPLTNPTNGPRCSSRRSSVDGREFPNKSEGLGKFFYHQARLSTVFS